MKPEVAPFGAWPSPIPAEALSAGVVSFELLTAFDDRVFWIESRPEEGGRSVVVEWSPGGEVRTRTPEGFNVRSRVHEYGGGALAVDGDSLYFVNFADQRIWRQKGHDDPIPLTPEGKLRFGDLAVDPHHGRLLAVCEDHTHSDLTPDNFLVAVSLEAGDPEVLVSGNDFYQAPRPSPDGSRLAWVTWNHPNLPWDSTELWVATVSADGSLGGRTRVAGEGRESVCHPEWAPEGTLCFISDRAEWWNLYEWKGGRARAVGAAEAEFGRPGYALGGSSYSFLGDRFIVATATSAGITRLLTIDREGGAARELASGCTGVAQPRVAGGRVAFIGASPTQPAAVSLIDPNSEETSILRVSSAIQIDPGFLQDPEHIEFPTGDGEIAYGFYYRPLSPHARGPGGERPPLVVMVHGGPTSAVTPALSLGIASPLFWTSRGLAVLDVNYRGSTGYGRTFRRALYERWGEVDIDDSIDGARYLAERGEIDGRRVVVRGGSAGGYTVLCALSFRDFFTAGAAYFGISDLVAFHEETHKFESRYDNQLIGRWPEEKERYIERSPINFVDRINAPLLLLQGLEDRIVPPNQSEVIYEALKARGVPVAYLAFEGEGHGFRKSENIHRSLEAEAHFYARVLGLPVDGGSMSTI